jgi:DNA-binding response OmpR family regulator
VVSKTDLCFVGKEGSNPMSFKALEMHMVAIRKKLKTASGQIQTVRGLGYKID